jgi:hypothetical protein
MFVVDSIFNLIAYRQFLRIEDLRYPTNNTNLFGLRAPNMPINENGSSVSSNGDLS